MCSLSFSQTVAPSMGTSTLSSALTNNSQQYCRTILCSEVLYYYEAIEVNVLTSGNYIIQSNSTMDTLGFIFEKSKFDPRYPIQNLLLYDDDSGGSSQFLFEISLQSTTKYIIVITTYFAGVVGPFSIITTGPASLDLSQANISSKM